MRGAAGISEWRDVGRVARHMCLPCTNNLWGEAVRERQLRRSAMTWGTRCCVAWKSDLLFQNNQLESGCGWLKKT